MIKDTRASSNGIGYRLSRDGDRGSKPRARAILLLALLLGGCYDTEQGRQYDQYVNERVLVKVCGGIKIYEWQGRYYTPSSTRWPDQLVIGPEVCK